MSGIKPTLTEAHWQSGGARSIQEGGRAYCGLGKAGATIGGQSDTGGISERKKRKKRDSHGARRRVKIE